jgi:hypothetical protein
LWSATFPVNSAARSLGVSAIGLLLILTAYQGYTQYFTAWANSSQTYLAYNRATSAAAQFAYSRPKSEQDILVGDVNENPVTQYLLQHKQITFITPDELKSLPTGQPRNFIITADAHDTVVSTLVQRFPGGTLKSHLDRDGSELFYDYSISK